LNPAAQRLELDALDRAALSAHVAASPSSVGAHAISSPAHAAIDGTHPRSQETARAMEPRGSARTAGVASSLPIPTSDKRHC